MFVFDTWVREVRKRGYRLTAQFHDEIVLNILEGQEDKCRQDLTEAMVETNKLLKLNVEIGVDVQFGKTYAEIH